MESELKKAVNLYEKGQLNSAKEIALNIYNSKPDYFDNLRLLNFIHFKNGDFSDAIKIINEAIKINPNFAELYNEKANALNELKKLEESIKNYDEAIKINPNYADAYYNKGLVLHQLNKFELAIENYDEAIKINPNYARAYNNKGYALQKIKKLDESIKNFSTTLKINPNFDFLFGELIHAKNKICDWETLDQDLKLLNDQIFKKKKITTPFPTLQLFDSPLIQKISAEIWTKEKYSNKKKIKIFKKIVGNKKIRIGYYSPDFYNHAMAYLLSGLFESHDKSKFELFGFSFGPEKNDEMSKRIPKAFDKFIKIHSKNDSEVALLSNELKIDIAVDLSCFTANNRIGIFSKRCAPIQINYLGYPGTSGTDFIEYIIADKILIPKKNQKYYSEKIIYFPDTYQVRDSSQKISKKKFTRNELDLPKKGIVLCCFNQSYKITPKVFKIWIRLLKNIKGSVLWLLEDNLTATKNLKKEAELRGVKSERIIFAKRLPLSDHLARHKVADLFIDTFPYTAHTTCSDALWSSLPVITRMGESFASRVAGSILSAIDLKELITHTEDEYEKLIYQYATNPKKLKKIKKKLEKNKVTKPLFNTKLFTKNIETAYKIIYKNYYSNLPIKNIEIK